MLNKGKKIFLCIFYISFFSLASMLSSAYGADSLSQKNTQLTNVNSKISLLKRNIQLTEKQRGQLEVELTSTNKKIDKITQQVAGLNQKMLNKKMDLETSKQQLTSLEENLNNQKKLLGEQLRASYKLGQYEYLQLVLNQQDPSKTLRLITYYRYIHESRLKTLEEIKKTQADILKEQEIFAVQVAELDRLYKEEQHIKIQLEQSQQKRQKIMEKLNQQIQTQSAKLKEYELDRKRLEALITHLKKTVPKTVPVVAPKQASSSVHSVFSPTPVVPISSSFSKSQHHLIWPTNGRILNRSSIAVLRNEPRYSGVFIQAPEGQPVMAVYPGKVVFANWLKGFGLLVIINHGQGFMTLYADNQTLYRKRGDMVKAGDLIANVGHTGILSQSGLYFEIRYNGKPLNAVQWLAPGIKK